MRFIKTELHKYAFIIIIVVMCVRIDGNRRILLSAAMVKGGGLYNK